MDSSKWLGVKIAAVLLTAASLATAAMRLLAFLKVIP